MLKFTDATSSQLFTNISAQTTDGATNTVDCEYSCFAPIGVDDVVWYPSIVTVTVATAFTTFGSNSSISISSATNQPLLESALGYSPLGANLRPLIGTITTFDSFTMYLCYLRSEYNLCLLMIS